MNTQQLVELITDAVTDAVREALPRMVADALTARLAQVLTPALDRLEGASDSMQARVLEQLNAQQVEFATRGIAQCDALTTSWQRQAQLLRESIGDQVAQAVAGIPSQAGPAGPPGSPGRDATMVTPVHWAPDSHFRAGSVVMHRAGLWFANVDTSAEPGSGVDGFTLMFDGGELSHFEHDDNGFQLACYRHASGRTRRVETGQRAFTYLGVYDHETRYHVNDVVTASGSMWVCKATDAIGLRPGTDGAARTWQLAVKCGRDGRDGRDGAPGPRGERGDQGPPGVTAIRAPKQKAAGVQT